MSSHLFYRYQLIDWAFQTVPFSTAWVVRDDGALLGLTYMPEQDVIAWHRHDTDGLFESVACISEGDEDVLYCVVKRGSKRFIERMHTRYFATIRDAYFMDSGLTYDGRNTVPYSDGSLVLTTLTISGGTTWDHTETVTITASSVKGINGVAGFSAGDVGDQLHFRDEANNIVYRATISTVTDTTHVTAILNRLIPAAYRNSARTDWEFARNTMSGLGHLEGKSVCILADGNELPQQVVTGGAVTLEYPAAVVHIGLPIEADFETLDITAAGQNLRDKQKIINHVSLIVEEAANIWVGPDADHLTEYKQRSTESYDESTRLASGNIDLRIQATWNKNGRLFIRQSKPLPLTILAVIPEVSVGGS